MPKFINKLDELLADAVLTGGFARITTIKMAKQYWDSLQEQQKIDEMKQITSLPELALLNSLGVPKRIYNIFLGTISTAQTIGGSG
ncbi:MAG: hypothetical protein ACREBA_01005 [Nitrosotalea sp.]